MGVGTRWMTAFSEVTAKATQFRLLELKVSIGIMADGCCALSAFPLPNFGSQCSCGGLGFPAF